MNKPIEEKKKTDIRPDKDLAVRDAGKGKGKEGRRLKDITAAAEEEVGGVGAGGFIEKVVAINRITKVTKGGKRLCFSALVVVGDTKGRVGYNLAKAKEVSIAIRKALGGAKNNLVSIPMKGTTIPHAIVGHCGAASVLLKPATDGTGVIAAGPVRAICDGAGIRNILTKCHKSNNPINVIKATFDGLMRLKDVR
jgi:small subunit ribosomal protein S5